MNPQTQRPDPRKLLEAFVTSSRSEKAFTSLVACLSGLVFSSALRRTGNAQLSEEVAQNVFAIMARKASSLLSHPSLEAWTLETTRLEAASVMRSEKRRLRKLAELSVETDILTPTSDDIMNPSATWEDALPALDDALDSLPMQDRDVILQRFYDGKKFQEIAATNGQTEAACKMRMTRALEKLSRFLTARGATLTATGVATLLTTEFARSATVPSVASLASNALAASSSLSTTSLLINTVQTMSTIKTTTLTAAATIALAAIPLFSQYTEGNRFESQLAAREIQTSRSNPASFTTASRPPRTGDDNANRRPGAEGYLATLDQNTDHLTLIRSLVESSSTDSLREDLLLAKVGKMSSEERAQFLAELKKFPIPSLVKTSITTSIAKFSPQVSYQENLERLLLSGQTTYDADQNMREWAKTDPDAALKWYQETKAAGKFYSGLGNDFQKETSSQFIDGATKVDPQLAMDFYQSTPREEMSDGALLTLARGVSDAVVKSGDTSMVQKLLDSHTAPEDRQDILVGMLYSHVNAQKYDEGAAFVEAHEPDEERRYRILQQTFQSVRPAEIDAALTSVLTATYEKHGVTIVRRLLEDSGNRQYDYPAWWKRQTPEVQQQLPQPKNDSSDKK